MRSSNAPQSTALFWTLNEDARSATVAVVETATARSGSDAFIREPPMASSRYANLSYRV